jgi:hypothetical protein
MKNVNMLVPAFTSIDLDLNPYFSNLFKWKVFESYFDNLLKGLGSEFWILRLIKKEIKSSRMFKSYKAITANISEKFRKLKKLEN